VLVKLIDSGDEIVVDTEGWTRIRSVTKMIRLSRKMPFSAKMLPSH
jgi:hypothetical protein